MTVAQITKKNIELSEKFSDYLIQNPKKADVMRGNAHVVVMPKNNKALAEQNEAMIQKMDKRKSIYIARELGKGWSIERI